MCNNVSFCSLLFEDAYVDLCIGLWSLNSRHQNLMHWWRNAVQRYWKYELRPISSSNEILKFADDTYLIVPAQGCHACDDELEHVRSWASDNNLTLNRAKSKEIIFRAREVRGATSQPWTCLSCRITLTASNGYRQDNGSRHYRQRPANFDGSCQQSTLIMF